MFRIAMAVVVVAAIMGVGVSLSAPPAAAQQPSATRFFDKTTVEPGENVTVTITIEDYGGLGAVTEMLPDGFSYVSSDLDTVQVTEVDTGTVRFTLQGDSLIYVHRYRVQRGGFPWLLWRVAGLR